MQKRKILSFLLTVVCTMSLLSGCGNMNSSNGANKNNSDHEPITINAPYQNMDAFIDKVHEKYPEINIEIVPYSGQNTTAWMKAMLSADDLTDIYFTSVYFSDADNVSDKLLDLSGYPFTNNYVQARLREVTTDDAAVYMLPLSYSCIGLTYNKTLLEKNGWTLPTSLKEMEELKPKVEAAGYNFCVDLIQYPGYGFQYMCNILDTGFLSTTDGLRWQSDFLSGKANVADTPAMLENMNLLQRWKDIGLLTSENANVSDTETREFLTEGNTLFCVGNTLDLSKEEDVSDEFKIMPYLSEDGDQNVFILSVNRYVGLNNHLADSGNEQKLEDAMHIMEVLSTEEGMWSLRDQKGSALLPLKDAEIEADSYYSDAIDELNDSRTAPFIYSGWENIIVPIGNVMLDYIAGNSKLQDIIECIDENQKNIGEGSATAYTISTEVLDTDDCSRLVGIALAQAADADAALISENEYHEGDPEMNWYGVSGSLFDIPVTEQEIVSILPTGWNNNIETVTLTGKRIKELAETGYDKEGDGNTYPYALVTKEGTELEDSKTYTVVICGATEEVETEGSIKDTGILGLDAMKDYLGQFKTLSKKDIVWK